MLRIDVSGGPNTTYSIPPWLYRKHPEILVTRLGGPLDRAVREALSDCTGMSPATNFLHFDLSTLPEGT